MSHSESSLVLIYSSFFVSFYFLSFFVFSFFFSHLNISVVLVQQVKWRETLGILLRLLAGVVTVIKSRKTKFMTSRSRDTDLPRRSKLLLTTREQKKRGRFHLIYFFFFFFYPFLFTFHFLIYFSYTIYKTEKWGNSLFIFLFIYFFFSLFHYSFRACAWKYSIKMMIRGILGWKKTRVIWIRMSTMCIIILTKL